MLRPKYRQRWIICIVLLFLIAILPQTVAGQGNTVTVPDVTGMSVPQAAAILNRAGLRLGAEDNLGWTPDSGLPQDSISGQSPPAGERVETGATVDVQVLRSNNVVLIYDDNDLTLVNQSGDRIRLEGIVLRAIDGTQEAFFTATRWNRRLDPGDCAQVWSVSRREPKRIDECTESIFWTSTTNPAAHFWTGAHNATQFSITQNGVERGICPVANPGRCELFLETRGRNNSTPFVYFAYTPDQLIVRNISDDQWMLLNNVQIINNAPSVAGSTFEFGDPDVFGNPDTIGRINQLAPGQCLLYTNGGPNTGTPPQPCDLVARLDLDPSVNFWAQEFGVDSTTDNQPHTCPAATPDKLTVCIMPR
ncbi:MAG: PASTA domain-containing protein [Chloroflexi bacterium]|nr:MAG: PASTA domain-containing protein [Chloroflexota bacterium]